MQHRLYRGDHFIEVSYSHSKVSAIVQVEFTSCRSIVIIIVKTCERATVNDKFHHFASGTLLSTDDDDVWTVSKVVIPSVAMPWFTPSEPAGSSPVIFFAVVV